MFSLSFTQSLNSFCDYLTSIFAVSETLRQLQEGTIRVSLLMCAVLALSIAPPVWFASM